MTITKEEFEQKFCKHSNIDRAFYTKHLVTEPCEECEYPFCPGWKAVTRGHPRFVESALKEHRKLQDKP